MGIVQETGQPAMSIDVRRCPICGNVLSAKDGELFCREHPCISDGEKDPVEGIGFLMKSHS